MSNKAFQELTAAADGLVLHSAAVTADEVQSLAGAARLAHAVAAPPPDPAERTTIALVCRDLQDLRRTISGLGACGAAAQLVVWFVDQPLRLPVPALRPDWPRLLTMQAAHGDDSYLALQFTEPVPARSFLVQVGRAASPDGRSSVQWPTLGVARQRTDLWPVADPAATVALPRRLFDLGRDDAPDVITVGAPAHPSADLAQSTAHEVLGRPPVLVTVEPEPTWEAPGAGDSTASARSATSTPLGDWLRVGPVDERVVNPVGFDRSPVGSAVRPAPADDAGLAVRSKRGPRLLVHPNGHVTDGAVALLRTLPGIALSWEGTAGPVAYARAVGHLAALGVPLVGDAPPPIVARYLAPGIADALGTPDDLVDRLRREELSVRLRRAALSRLGASAWRRELARRTGSQSSDRATVSVLLTTRRPDMLPFALDQLRRQRGVSFEVVLTTHGFEPSTEDLAPWLETFGERLQPLHAESDLLFGQVLNLAASRASGDLLLKVDDDDWYGPDFVADLLLAREYSGAEVVGCSAEFTFVEPLWLTTRNDDPSEVYRPFVAGGTILVDRGAFRAVGGFRHTRKHVDANLLSAILNAGGNVYRSHGLGYVLRRGTHGHTWDPGLAYFVSSSRAADQWRGFQPSTVMDPATCIFPVRQQEQS